METEDKLNLSQELESLKKHLDLAKDKLSYWTEVEFTQLTTVQADRHDSTVKSLLGMNIVMYAWSLKSAMSTTL